MSVHKRQRSRGAIRVVTAATVTVALMLGFSSVANATTVDEDVVVDETTTSVAEEAPAPKSTPEAEAAPAAPKNEEVAPAATPAPAPEVKEEAPALAPEPEVATEAPAETPAPKVEAAMKTTPEPTKFTAPTIGENPGKCQVTISSSVNETLIGVLNDGQRDGYAVSFMVSPNGATTVDVAGDIKFGFVYVEGGYDPETGDGFTRDITLTGDYSNCDGTQPPHEEQSVEVIPAAATSSDACGTDNDTYTVPSTEGVVYKADGQPTESGTFPATGLVTVTAEATEGYELKEGATATWVFDFSNEPCAPPVYTPVTFVEAYCDGSVFVDVDNTEGEKDFPYTVIVNGEEFDFIAPSGEYGFEALEGAENGSTVTVTDADGNELASTIVPEACPPQPDYAGVGITAFCSAVEFVSFEDNPFLNVLYGNFDNESPDGEFVLAPGETKTVKTLSSSLDGLIYSDDYQFLFEEFENVMVPQDCEIAPPIPPVTDTPTPPATPDKDGGNPTTPVSNTPATPVKDVPVKAALPNTGAPDLAPLWAGAAMLLLGGAFMVGRRKTHS